MSKQVFSNHWSTIFYNPTYLIRKKLYNAVKENSVHLQGKLLDFGCGNKPYEHLFAHVTAYVGVDFESDRVNGENKPIDLVYDGKNIPTESNYFDSVLSTEVFEHVFDLEQVLNEIRRVLKPNGSLFFTCPFSFEEHEKPYDFARYTSFALKYLLEKNGFEVIEYQKTGTHISVIFQYIALYIYYIISKFSFLKHIFFVILITPVFLISEFWELILPKKISRDNLYLNNIVLCKKK